MRWLALSLSLALASLSSVATAQDWRTIPEPVFDKGALPLGTGRVEGATGDEIWFELGGRVLVRNVTTATLTPVLPKRRNANGAAVIIAPGGAFGLLALDHEGFAIAHWLADRGIAAFVLKYRTNPSGASVPDFQRQLTGAVSAVKEGTADALPVPEHAIADAQAALSLVRMHASEWKVDTNRLGFMGFSAGAMLTLAITEKLPAEASPSFIAMIYGPTTKTSVPKAAPPLFGVIAADDEIFGGQGFDLITQWQKANRPVEFHIYDHGGHGFGAGSPNNTAGDWLSSFYHWMGTSGFLHKK